MENIKLKVMRVVKLSVVLMILIFHNAHGQKVNLHKVDFLIGTWKMEGKENYEIWKKTDNQLVGEAFKISNKQKHISEKLEIKLVDAHIVYIATVLNQNEGKGISFTLKQPEENLFSFENMKHDFPKKIRYKTLNKNELFVSVLGNDDKGFSYKLIRQVD
ncbi:hypothetical protein IWQ47_003146 [Aquimarina sp. EL_43]|uniref:DUF6265 family protein n=1 Tax=unclassified Aquimarina TaxID=2627091 RepID=UPI0018CBDD10|nr:MULTISPECIES: DUF6265 family protein [unclassified Aquimarina]MBG6131535.1 hypothetical protein [Aquimarina sp. EL_35]MBG6151995.1 hypothetical protein [Aquimarina sp. EL_32]MBG6170061.1 hypothetical protein [Aquimarina sp. EL_43]